MDGLLRFSFSFLFVFQRSTSHLGSELTGHLQLAPSVDHQVSAMLSILDRYHWRQFGIVTSEVCINFIFIWTHADKECKKILKVPSHKIFLNNID